MAAAKTVKPKRGQPNKRAFLAVYKLTASVTKAAKAAKCERGLHYRWLETDEQYAADFAKAQEEAGQLLEDEAIRRAHEGTLKPLVYQGRFQYRTRKNKATGLMENYGAPIAIREYSNELMMFLLRGFKPEKYRDKGSVELTGPVGGPIALADPRLAKLDDDELAGLIAAAKKIVE